MAPVSGSGESEVIKIPDSRPLLPLATTREPAEGGVEVGESTEETTTTASESSQSCSPEGAYKEQGSDQSSVRASSRIATEVSGEGAVPEAPVSPTSAVAPLARKFRGKLTQLVVGANWIGISQRFIKCGGDVMYGLNWLLLLLLLLIPVVVLFCFLCHELGPCCLRSVVNKYEMIEC